MPIFHTRFLIIATILLTISASMSKSSSSNSFYSAENNQNIRNPNEGIESCNLEDLTNSLPSWEQNFEEGAASMTTSMALVPFDESKVLPHEKPEREFTLAGHKFTIKQNWHTLGVAAVVWDSAVVLAEYLVENKDLVKGKNVIELGAGTGLTGMVAAALGGRVTVTERDEAMSHLKASIEYNIKDKIWEISAETLDWTQPLDEIRFPTPDIIIGADIVYIEDTFQDLLRTILSLAKTKKTFVLLSCKIRYDRDIQFLNLLRDNFEVKEVLYDKDRDIKIFSLLRSS